MGVMVRKSHTPCMSGWPSSVRGGVHDFAVAVVVAPVGAWSAATDIDVSNATPITTIKAPSDATHRLRMSNLLSNCSYPRPLLQDAHARSSSTKLKCRIVAL